jgi:hypothetical protein
LKPTGLLNFPTRETASAVAGTLQMRTPTMPLVDVKPLASLAL